MTSGTVLQIGLFDVFHYEADESYEDKIIFAGTIKTQLQVISVIHH